MINYIPHHAVTNSNKSGKIRVVFDAAAKDKGTLLNDKLLKGPHLFNCLIGLLITFRKGKYAVVADIELIFQPIFVLEKAETRYFFFGERHLQKKLTIT